MTRHDTKNINLLLKTSLSILSNKRVTNLTIEYATIENNENLKWLVVKQIKQSETKRNKTYFPIQEMKGRDTTGFERN